MDTRLTIMPTGEVTLRERGPEAEPNTYPNSTKLVDRLVEVGPQFYLEIDIDPDEHEGCRIGLSVYHLENTDTGQAFHAIMNADLSRDQVAQLHGYLSFLLATRNWSD